MECKICNSSFKKKCDYVSHNSTEKHILNKTILDLKNSISKKDDEFQKKLEEVNFEKEREIKLAEEKLKECRLKALNANTKMELINLKMFQHLRDHDIDLTTDDYHSKLSTIETSFVSSKSACESVFHDNLTNILFKSMGTNSINNCYLCSEFKQYSSKVLNQEDFINIEGLDNLNETNSNVKKLKKNQKY
jgi:hypothetical protein